MPSCSLEDYDIYLKKEASLDSIAKCPSQLRDLFTLILSVQRLDWDYFGGTLGENRSFRATPLMQYESELKLEAEELSRTCIESKRPDDLEEKWVQVLQPIVFYRFDREAEELYTRNRHHHCFICAKHFPLRSRPLLGTQSSRLFESKLRGVQGSNEDSEDADVCRVHANIPNFDIEKSTYLGFKDENTKIPDLTIGLLLWSKDAWKRPPDMDNIALDQLMEHDLMKPFRQDIIKKLEDTGHIKPLLFSPKGKKGTHVDRMSKPALSFPFAIWEAKRASEGDPVAQNALKVRMILEWQQDLAKRAKIAWKPLVFHFVSTGSEWKLYACHIETSYVFRLLWSGDCANQTKALQLLYLVDIIALWGQFQYKPFAGACIRVLEQTRKGGRFRALRRTNLLEHQKFINATNFPSIQPHGISTIDLMKSTIKLKLARTMTSESEVDMQLSQGLRMLSLDTYYIPERDGFIWLLHGNLHGADLLVVRVNSAGSVLPALLIFNASNWKSQDFKRIIEEERARMPKNVEIDFRYDEEKSTVLQKCFDGPGAYCTMPEIQFCAILPLKRRQRHRESSARNHLRPLEQLLNLQTLIDAAQKEQDLWCTCQQDDEGAMILCDSTQCSVGWYHNQCVDLAEDYKANHWYCDKCEASSNFSYSKYDNKHTYGEGIRPASDERIQRARSLARAWNNHKWPDKADVRHMINRKICCEIEMETNSDSFRDTVEYLETRSGTSSTRCRAILREDPLRMTRIRQRFRSPEDS